MKWGYTPLLRGTVKGYAEVSHFLLQHGSVPYEKEQCEGTIASVCTVCIVVFYCTIKILQWKYFHYIHGHLFTRKM